MSRGVSGVLKHIVSNIEQFLDEDSLGTKKHRNSNFKSRKDCLFKRNSPREQ